MQHRSNLWKKVPKEDNKVNETADTMNLLCGKLAQFCKVHSDVAFLIMEEITDCARPRPKDNWTGILINNMFVEFEIFLNKNLKFSNNMSDNMRDVFPGLAEELLRYVNKETLKAAVSWLSKNWLTGEQSKKMLKKIDSIILYGQEEPPRKKLKR